MISEETAAIMTALLFTCIYASMLLVKEYSTRMIPKRYKAIESVL